MTRFRNGWRLAALLFLLAMLSPVGVGARGNDLSCDEFNTPDAAQVLLEVDPDLFASLDADGDGRACNEDGERDDAASADDAAYLDTVQDHLQRLIASSNRLNQLADEGDLSAGGEREIEYIFSLWAEAGAVAEAVDAPEGYEEIQAAYEDVAFGFVDLYHTIQRWLLADDGSDESDEAYAEYEVQYQVVYDLVLTLQDLLDDEGL